MTPQLQKQLGSPSLSQSTSTGEHFTFEDLQRCLFSNSEIQPVSINQPSVTQRKECFCKYEPIRKAVLPYSHNDYSPCSKDNATVPRFRCTPVSDNDRKVTRTNLEMAVNNRLQSYYFHVMDDAESM